MTPFPLVLLEEVSFLTFSPLIFCSFLLHDYTIPPVLALAVFRARTSLEHVKEVRANTSLLGLTSNHSPQGLGTERETSNVLQKGLFMTDILIFVV